MKRILFLFLAIGLSWSAMAMGKGKVRKETRFLTDKMAYELNLSHRQYDDVYEINYDFIYSIRHIMDEVVCGYEWALDDYYEALDIRNDDLRWVLSDRQYRRFIALEYFHRPIYVHRGGWHLRVYLHYPDRDMFYFGVPHHYHSYCGGHCRPHIHHVSYYRGRHSDFHHCVDPHWVRDRRDYHSYRRSDFGSVRFRPNSAKRPSHIPSRSSHVTSRSDFSSSKENERHDISRKPNQSHRRSDKNLNVSSDHRSDRVSSNRRSEGVSERQSRENYARRNSTSSTRTEKHSSDRVRRNQHGNLSRSSEREREIESRR